jgi:hypothetical protein
MNELENLKEKIFELVEYINVLETNPNNSGEFIFTRKQLLNYSKFLIDDITKGVIEDIKRNIDQDMIDESIELEMGYNREINVHIDERGLQHQIIASIEESVTVDIEDLVDNTLNIVFQ